jgi:hypothetical protein
MGQYRLVISFSWSIGFWLKYEPSSGIRSFSVLLPLIGVYVGLTEHAHGVEIFGRDI